MFRIQLVIGVYREVPASVSAFGFSLKSYLNSSLTSIWKT